LRHGLTQALDAIEEEMTTVLNLSDYIIIAGLIGVFGGIRYLRGQVDPLGKANARKLDAIIEYFNIPVQAVSRPGALSPEVQKLASEGRVLDAIKEYRDETGAGLKEAKSAVDDYLSQAHVTTHN
jgi:hypothetical protein